MADPPSGGFVYFLSILGGNIVERRGTYCDQRTAPKPRSTRSNVCGVATAAAVTTSPRLRPTLLVWRPMPLRGQDRPGYPWATTAEPWNPPGVRSPQGGNSGAAALQRRKPIRVGMVSVQPEPSASLARPDPVWHVPVEDRLTA
jgi:hypothetical protein